MKQFLLFSCLFLSFLGKAQTVGVAVGAITPHGMIKSGDYLYIAEVNAYRISKINTTGTSTLPIVYDDLFLYGPTSFAIHGNYLYICQIFSDKISKIDLTNPSPVLIDVVTGLNDPGCI